ncbi:hypothetical protein BN873_940010 [Candidatus Competibacter denitrificans Run_A_D11]|uniref:Uncharacterized protein n=1 Tax=Candidatus Competibacter denitrificans Run_A_D11 TaxID=1400863 RepID=W6MCT5_9GAMM|nr:hypothetical protein BN873_940010 [Candidatus Competibacter denitrificans Run_A_D11]
MFHDPDAQITQRAVEPDEFLASAVSKPAFWMRLEDANGAFDIFLDRQEFVGERIVRVECLRGVGFMIPMRAQLVQPPLIVLSPPPHHLPQTQLQQGLLGTQRGQRGDHVQGATQGRSVHRLNDGRHGDVLGWNHLAIIPHRESRSMARGVVQSLPQVGRGSARGRGVRSADHGIRPRPCLPDRAGSARGRRPAVGLFWPLGLKAGPPAGRGRLAVLADPQPAQVGADRAFRALNPLANDGTAQPLRMELFYAGFLLGGQQAPTRLGFAFPVGCLRFEKTDVFVFVQGDGVRAGGGRFGQALAAGAVLREGFDQALFQLDRFLRVAHQRHQKIGLVFVQEVVLYRGSTTLAPSTHLHFKWKWTKFIEFRRIFVDQLACRPGFNAKLGNNDTGINAGFAVNHGKGQNSRHSVAPDCFSKLTHIERWCQELETAIRRRAYFGRTRIVLAALPALKIGQAQKNRNSRSGEPLIGVSQAPDQQLTPASEWGQGLAQDLPVVYLETSIGKIFAVISFGSRISAIAVFGIYLKGQVFFSVFVDSNQASIFNANTFRIFELKSLTKETQACLYLVFSGFSRLGCSLSFSFSLRSQPPLFSLSRFFLGLLFSHRLFFLTYLIFLCFPPGHSGFVLRRIFIKDQLDDIATRQLAARYFFFNGIRRQCWTCYSLSGFWIGPPIQLTGQSRASQQNTTQKHCFSHHVQSSFNPSHIVAQYPEFSHG